MALAGTSNLEHKTYVNHITDVKLIEFVHNMLHSPPLGKRFTSALASVVGSGARVFRAGVRCSVLAV